MKTLFCRAGNKTPIADKIINLFPKHKIYVEPFVGSGAVYFHKEPSAVEVLNDIDTELMKGYRLVKQASSDPSRYKDFDSIEQIQQFYDKTPTTTEDKLTHSIIRFCNGFSGRAVIHTVGHFRSNPHSKTDDIKKYKDRLKNTILLSQDYKTVIEKYDSTDTLFYLDPPYENSSGLYKHHVMDYAELSKTLSNIKGKFILTIHDSASIRSAFRNHKKRSILVKAKHTKDISKNDRRELIITNF